MLRHGTVGEPASVEAALSLNWHGCQARGRYQEWVVNSTAFDQRPPAACACQTQGRCRGSGLSVGAYPRRRRIASTAASVSERSMQCSRNANGKPSCSPARLHSSSAQRPTTQRPAHGPTSGCGQAVASVGWSAGSVCASVTTNHFASMSSVAPRGAVHSMAKQSSCRHARGTGAAGSLAGTAELGADWAVQFWNTATT